MLSNSNRSTAHAVAALLNLAGSVFGVLISLPPLQDGADAAAASGDQPPFAIIILSLILGTLGFVSSYGVWQGQRWGVIFTIVLNAVGLLSGIPGILFGPTTFLVVASVIGSALNIAIIVLLLRRAPAQSTSATNTTAGVA